MTGCIDHEVEGVKRKARLKVTERQWIVLHSHNEDTVVQSQCWCHR